MLSEVEVNIEPSHGQLTTMKKRYLFPILLLAILIFLPKYITKIVTNPIPSTTKTTVKIPVNKNRLYKDVETLTSILPARNYLNMESLNQSADYIFKELEKAGCRMERQKYEVDGRTYQNIIGSIGPASDSRLIVGAHYDVCGDQAGADDNASAVAGLLEIARLINEMKPELKQRIDFVAYTLEEPPFFGSKYMGSAVHAESLFDNNVDVKGMICLEMIGYFSEEKDSQKYPIGFMKKWYPNKGNFIAVIGKLGQSKPVKTVKKLMRQAANIDVYSINAPTALQGIDFSDHRNYWNYGYDAVMINNTAFYRNQNYHKTSDTIETLDFEKMSEVVRGAYWVVVNY